KLPALSGYADALRRVLNSSDLDDAFKAAMLALPGEQEIASSIGKDIDPARIHDARERVRAVTSRTLMDVLEELWRQTESPASYRPDPAGTGRRSLRYAVLAAICAGDPARGAELASLVLTAPPSMTDEIGALTALSSLDRPEREEAIDA